MHGKKITVCELGKILAVRKALVAPAVPALLFIAMSWVGLLSLSTALMASIVALILSFALYSLLAGLRIHSTWYEIILSSLLETALGAGIILLKIAVGH